MRLTGLDLLFWAAGFVANLGLLFVLWYRRRARVFPFLTALITLNVGRTIVLYLVLRYAAKNSYFYTYWSLIVLDTTLQLCSSTRSPLAFSGRWTCGHTTCEPVSSG